MMVGRHVPGCTWLDVSSTSEGSAWLRVQGEDGLWGSIRGCLVWMMDGMQGAGCACGSESPLALMWVDARQC